MKAGQSSVKRAVVCNGIRYESLSAAARGVNVPLYKLYRIICGRFKINGIEINDDLPRVYDKSLEAQTGHKAKKEQKPGKRVLLYYPLGENNIERGLPVPWK